MISEGHVYVLNRGESVSLECNFHADQYDLFDYPVLWRKVQHDEETQVNIMGTINEPFVLSNRFEVAFASTASRYRLVLTISGELFRRYNVLGESVSWDTVWNQWIDWDTISGVS